MAQETRRRPLKGLSNAAKTAARKRQVFGRLRLNGWLKILRELASYDEAGDQLRSRAKRGSAISVVSFVVLLFLLFSFWGEANCLLSLWLWAAAR